MVCGRPGEGSRMWRCRATLGAQELCCASRVHHVGLKPVVLIIGGHDGKFFQGEILASFMLVSAGASLSGQFVLNCSSIWFLRRIFLL